MKGSSIMKTTIISQIQILLRGVGQVMLQNNALSGLIFLAGIFYQSWIMGVAALAGTWISTLTARFLKFRKEDIENGLFGFNGTLTAIAIFLFFGVNFISFTGLIAGCCASSLVMRLMMKLQLPPYTAPFIITTWLAISVIHFGAGIELVNEAPVSDEKINFLSACLHGFGQVMFQKNVVTGFLFLTGIFIHSRRAALMAIYASLLGVLAGWVLLIPVTSLNAGLAGYNAILCALALYSSSPGRFLRIGASVILSVLLYLVFQKTGIIILTAPFVLATWLITVISKKSGKNKKMASLQPDFIGYRKL